MQVEILRKHRKSLIKARREIKAKLELLDTLLEEATAVPSSSVVEAFRDAQALHDESLSGTGINVVWQAAQADAARRARQRAAEWDAAKAYQTAARNAYRNVMRAVDLDDPVYSKTDMERQRATEVSS